MEGRFSTAGTPAWTLAKTKQRVLHAVGGHG